MPTVNALADEKALAAPACRVPAATLVAPEYVLRPDSVSVPVPLLVRPNAEVPFCNVPPNVVEVLSPPAVSVATPAPLLVTIPAPAREPMVWLNPLRSTAAPAPTVNALAVEKALAAPACSVPAVTLVAPE